MKATFVTTLDNPYNYFTQFDDWYAFDTQMGYNTCAYVDRIAKTSRGMSFEEMKRAINDAVDEIVKMNVTGNYTIVEEEGNGEEKVVKDEEEK